MPESVQTNRAPLVKLFYNGLIGPNSKLGAANSDGDRVEESGFLFGDTATERHADAVKALFSVLPSEEEMGDIFNIRSSWWPSWRNSFGLAWGEKEDTTLEAFATRALRVGHPALLGSLSVCFAFSTGDHKKIYIPSGTMDLIQ